MSRPIRIEYEGAFYHVMSRGNERKPIFRDNADRKKFLAIINEAHQVYRFAIHAYVLMTNHYHMLIETPMSNLSQTMRQINGVYTRYFNKKYERTGHLFQARYKSLIVEKDQYLIALTRYIHQNPLAARLCHRVSDYQWSSYPSYIGLTPAPRWLLRGDTLSYFGETPDKQIPAYCLFVEEKQEENPWPKAAANLILGSAQFVEAMKKIMREMTPNTEHSQRKKLERMASMEDVLFKISEAYKIKTDDLLGGRYKRLEPRSVAMHLLRAATGLNLQTIAKHFHVGYSAIALGIYRLKNKMKEDRALRQRVERLKAHLFDHESKK